MEKNSKEGIAAAFIETPGLGRQHVEHLWTSRCPRADFSRIHPLQHDTRV
jgi:hypothetical protein